MTDTPKPHQQPGFVPWHCDTCEREGCAVCRGERAAYASDTPHACANSPKIEPALTAESWKAMDAPDPAEQYRLFARVVDSFVLDDVPGHTRSELAAATIAFANAALPDDDPRKITREMVEAIRAVVEDHDATFGWDGRRPMAARAFEAAAALESYLPPE